MIDRQTVSTWSSGTGAAGVFGAVGYSALIQAGLSPKQTLLVMITVPVIQGLRSVTEGEREREAEREREREK